MKRITACSFIVLLCLPSIASAHLVSTRFGEFYSGLLHPLSNLIHLLPWIAVGLFIGLQNSRSTRLMLLVFPLSVLSGAGLGSLVAFFPFVTELNIFSLIFFGALTAMALSIAKKQPFYLACLALFGLSHGFANSAPELRGSDNLLYLLGLGFCAYLLTILVSTASRLVSEQQSWGTVAVRAAGSWVIAIGILYAGFSFGLNTPNA